jgi:hypothetical protein
MGHAAQNQARQMQRRVLCILQNLKRRNQPLLDLGEITAEWKRRQQPGFARGLQNSRDPLRRVVARMRLYFVVPRQLARIPGDARQLVLKARIRDRQQRRDDVGIGFPPDIGNPYSVMKISRRCRGMVSWP